jgi:hypothetical protein
LEGRRTVREGTSGGPLEPVVTPPVLDQVWGFQTQTILEPPPLCCIGIYEAEYRFSLRGLQNLRWTGKPEMPSTEWRFGPINTDVTFGTGCVGSEELYRDCTE